jgi:transposase
MPRPNAPRVDAAQRDAQALELRAAGASYRQIADRLGVSVSTAWGCVERGLDRTRREPADRLRLLELERLDRLQVEAVQVLRAQHYVVQAGEVVTHNGQEVVDHGPTLAARWPLT